MHEPEPPSAHRRECPDRAVDHVLLIEHVELPAQAEAAVARLVAQGRCSAAHLPQDSRQARLRLDVRRRIKRRG